ncbi:Conserved membrane protein of uncharacterised function [Mycobacteroides abscessus subsp. abscessus]|nr:Conserved membrane protein of uncharacterised function [Mycobacteroides abscessus subsp. abscessus]
MVFGPGAGATATAPAVEPGAIPPAPPGGQNVPVVPPVTPPPAGAAELSSAKAAALQEVQRAIGEVKEAQKSGDFARYGQALKGLDDAMTKFTQAR